MLLKNILLNICIEQLIIQLKRKLIWILAVLVQLLVNFMIDWASLNCTPAYLGMIIQKSVLLVSCGQWSPPKSKLFRMASNAMPPIIMKLKEIERIQKTSLLLENFCAIE